MAIDRAQVRARLVTLLGTERSDLDLLDRYDRRANDLWDAIDSVYPGFDADELLDILVSSHENRPETLRARDRARVLEPDWFQRETIVGYVCYTDQFAGNLPGVAGRIPYLRDLGVNYLHLMPLLTPRPGANDGGYAVMDYRSIRADLGTMADLAQTADKLHDAGISLTLDLVLNHVAIEHEWAAKARAGDSRYRDYFYVFDDREIPDAFEKTLPEVFPDFAPGNFTWDGRLSAWVWTTFNDYQWDVNWSNPDVFCEFADIVANLANHGVDCLRLDAIAFLWKRLGTDCQNQPEVHAITQALRSFARIFAPSLIFKAEAIVGPAQVGAYLGEGEHAGKVSDLAYHNSLMVQMWSAVASGETRLFERALSRFGALPTTTAWGVYARCHDDIGWAIDDSDAASVGLNGHAHRMFLADYFTGKFPGSDARGMDFQIDQASGERRTSGSSASLAGIESALEAKDDTRLAVAIRRYLCVYSMVFGFGGIPLLYMGDEIGMLNDSSFLEDSEKAADNRWLHRPAMDWAAALGATGKPSATAGAHEIAAHAIREGIERLIAARTRLPALHASVPTTVRATAEKGVIVFDRHHPAGHLVQVYNVSDTATWVDTADLGGLYGELFDHLSGEPLDVGAGFSLAPYDVRWLTVS